MIKLLDLLKGILLEADAKTERLRAQKENLNELRQGLLGYLKQQLPNMPEYVVTDWVYKMIKKDDDVNTKEGIQDWIDNQLKDTKWEYKTNFPISMDIFTDKTKKELQNRIGGEIRQDVGKDVERHKVQQDLLKSQGISKEPIIIFKTKNGKYELGEGWHRTTQSFKMYPEGYKQPKVYICLNAKWVNENVAPNHNNKSGKYGSGYTPYIQNEDLLNEKCWAGYERKGTKTMFGKKYPNCVKK